MKNAKIACLFAPMWLVSQACVPPAMRAAHSIEKGRVAVEIGHGMDQSQHQAQLLTLTGDDSLPLHASPATDYMVVVGLGAGVELGLGSNLMVKYSFLDEQRQDVPLSAAMMMSAGLNLASGGLLVSRHLDVSDAFAFRPVLNLLYSEREYRAVTAIPEALEDPDVPTSSPQMWTDLSTRSMDFPVGLEIPVTVGEKLTLTPSFSFTYSIPISVEATKFSCEGCAFAIEAYDMGAPMRLWMGVKLQPKLVVGQKVQAP